MKKRNNVNRLKNAYKFSKGAKVGETCTCPSCGSNFVKIHYAQAFCKNRPGSQCKDFYWNNVTPNKRNNTTRISPASAAWLSKNLDNIARKRGFPTYEAMTNYVDE